MKFVSYFTCSNGHHAAFGPRIERRSDTMGCTLSLGRRFVPVGVGAIDERGLVWRYCLDNEAGEPLAPLPAWVCQRGQEFIVEKC